MKFQNCLHATDQQRHQVNIGQTGFSLQLDIFDCESKHIVSLFKLLLSSLQNSVFLTANSLVQVISSNFFILISIVASNWKCEIMYWPKQIYSCCEYFHCDLSYPYNYSRKWVCLYFWVHCKCFTWLLVVYHSQIYCSFTQNIWQSYILKIYPSETWCRCHQHHVLLTLSSKFKANFIKK